MEGGSRNGETEIRRTIILVNKNIFTKERSFEKIRKKHIFKVRNQISYAKLNRNVYGGS